jgi:hypothetical protein
LGIGDWAQSPIPNPQSPIPNPHVLNNELKITKNYKIKKYRLVNPNKWIFLRNLKNYGKKNLIFLFFRFLE